MQISIYTGYLPITIPIVAVTQYWFSSNLSAQIIYEPKQPLGPTDPEVNTYIVGVWRPKIIAPIS